MFQRFSNFVLPYRKTDQTEKSSQTLLFLLHHPQQDIQITGIIRWKKNTFHVESWKCVNRVEGTRMYFPFARKMVTKQVRCKILGILCWRTVERPRNASEKEWSRQPQSCLSAVGLTGLGSQSKKRPCSVAMSTRCVCARLSSSLRDSCAHTRLVLSSASCPLSPTCDYIVIARVRSWNALDRGRLILLDKFGAIRWGYGRGILEGLEVLEDIVCVCVSFWVVIRGFRLGFWMALIMLLSGIKERRERGIFFLREKF